MRKKIFNFVYIVFVFVCALFMESIDVSAKKVSSSTFEVEVGTDKLPVYYSLEDDCRCHVAVSTCSNKRLK